MRIAHDHHPPISAKEHSIGDDHNWTRPYLIFRESICIQLDTNPFLALVVFSRQLISGAIIVGVVIPERCAYTFRPSGIAELYAAVYTFVSLDIVFKTIFYDMRALTFRAYFIVFLCRIIIFS